jgi:hypothetical protein
VSGVRGEADAGNADVPVRTEREARNKSRVQREFGGHVATTLIEGLVLLHRDSVCVRVRVLADTGYYSVPISAGDPLLRWGHL